VVEARINVSSLNPTSIYLPSVIGSSQGNSEQNFTIYTSQGKIEKVNVLQVFERWGNLIFDNENFQPNQPTEGWNGRFNEQEVKSGVYVYYIEVLHLDGTTEIFVDDITVLR